MTALAFVGLYVVGGQAPISLDTLITAMVGWHSIIGIGEAAITGLVVGMAASGPDPAHQVLVRDDLQGAAWSGAGHDATSNLDLLQAEERAAACRRRVLLRVIDPDGLDRVAQDHGIARTRRNTARARSPATGPRESRRPAVHAGRRRQPSLQARSRVA